MSNRKSVVVSVAAAVLPLCFAASCSVLESDAEDDVGTEVRYQVGDVTCKGYLACDDGYKGARPGVLVVHEWWGHNEYARSRADQLAEMGYVAFALDMYGGKSAEHKEQAGQLSGEIGGDLELAKARFSAAMEQLKAHPHTDPDKIAAIGYCFGGGVVLNMARAGLDLDGVASFHGSLNSGVKAEKGNVKAAVLVCHGGADQFIGADAVEAFKAEMGEAAVDLTFRSYDGAQHSFTNPGATEVGKAEGIPIAYDEAADKASWAELDAFLKRVFE